MKSFRRFGIPSIHWPRALLGGVLGVCMMMAFIDTFAMMGVTDFSLERYMGMIVKQEALGTHVWTAGLLGNLVLGALFGLVYAFFFESWLKRSGARTGAILGMAHALVASLTVFPFFYVVLSYAGFPTPAFDPFTLVLIFASHVLFGLTMGTVYGPVGAARVRALYSEPGDSLPFGDADAVSYDEDHPERAAV